jgi:uncharacterized protein YcbX
MPSADGRITALYRHPVKGFTPERLQRAVLEPGAFFPCDRIYAVEDGPSGFDPAAPAYIPKTAFTVLMRVAEVARARTAYDEPSGVLSAEAEGRPAIRARLTEPSGREAFAAWLTGLLGGEARGPLKVVSAAGHRFTDNPLGHVSIINLESVRDLERRTGWRVDPLRFRANLYVDGWPAWIENEAVGGALELGPARATVFKSITRCAATEVDPATAARDLPVPQALRQHYGHVFCGVYAHVTQGGTLAEGDPARL